MSMFSRPTIKYVGVILLLLLTVLLAGCTPSHSQSTFDTSGPVARSQLTLFYWIFWAAVFVFVTVVGFMLYTIIRYRRKPGDPDPPQIHGHKKLEIGWTISPAIILVIVAVPTIFTLFDNANSPLPPEEGGMEVEVIAHQWWWEFNYPQHGVKTSNELHIPVDTVVNVKLVSKDVLHSFWIPKLAGKVDVVPNNENKMWIQADDIGEYLGQCAEFCGVAHANMRFRVIAESEDDFNAWVTAQLAPGVTPLDPLAQDGQALFEGGARCFACHTVAGSKRSRGTRGPNLTHLMSRGHIAAGLLENNQANLRTWLRDPDAVKPGNIMGRDALIYIEPENELTEPDILALVAYLQSLE